MVVFLQPEFHILSVFSSIFQNHHLFLFFLPLPLPLLPDSLSYPGNLVAFRNSGRTRIKSIYPIFPEEEFLLLVGYLKWLPIKTSI